METEPNDKDVLDNLPLPPIYFEGGSTTYWYEKDGEWNEANESHALQHLHSMGVSNVKQKGSPYSRAQLVLAAIREKNVIRYAGPVAGLALGVYGAGRERYLSMSRPTLPDPIPGDWSDIQTLGERLFGPEQVEYVWAWSKNAVEGLYREKRTFSQALFLAGGAGCGKSFWQVNVVTPMLGGRMAKPIQYMTGQTSFNADIVGAEHLMLEDENVKRDHPSRRAFGTAIKEFTVNTSQRLHAKGANAVTVNSRHWITLSVNDEEENLHVLPPLDDSIKDKIILVHCNQAINSDWPGPNGAVEEMEKRVKAQMGAYVHWLLNEYQIPEALTDNRFGVKAYQNKELLLRIDIGDQELELLEMVERHWEQLFADGKALTITSHELQDALCGNPEMGYRAKKVLNWNGATGTYLNRLEKKFPTRITAHRLCDRVKDWTIRGV